MCGESTASAVAPSQGPELEAAIRRLRERGLREEIGARVRAARRERGITQEKLAAQLGVSHAAVCLWERGERSLDTQTLCRLAAALACRPGDILDPASPNKEGQGQ